MFFVSRVVLVPCTGMFQHALHVQSGSGLMYWVVSEGLVTLTAVLLVLRPPCSQNRASHLGEQWELKEKTEQMVLIGHKVWPALVCEGLGPLISLLFCFSTFVPKPHWCLPFPFPKDPIATLAIPGCSSLHPAGGIQPPHAGTACKVPWGAFPCTHRDGSHAGYGADGTPGTASVEFSHPLLVLPVPLHVEMSLHHIT